MIKTHKIALRPNREHVAWFYQQCGYAKFAYNSALSDFKAELASDTFLSMYDLNKRFNQKKKAFDWTKSQDQRAAMYAVHNLGIDVGISTLATLDDGTKYENPKALERYERKLKREQRKLSRKEFLSKNWYKQKRKVERLHYRVACIRKDAHDKATTEIFIGVSGVGIETLQITNLLKNSNLSKALSDAALGGFLEKLKTKATSLGIPIFQADRFFASSKTCSMCGHKKDALTLSERQYHCSNCGTSIDRDVNAAINLRTLAAGYAES